MNPCCAARVTCVVGGWGWICGRVFVVLQDRCVLLFVSQYGVHVPAKLGGLLVVLGVCVASVRPISTGRLGIAAVHLRPINPIVCWGPYTLKGVGKPHLETCFPLRCVQ